MRFSTTTARNCEKYAEMCVDDLFPWNRNFDLPVTTISLVQGTALGGGFEAALASSIVIAEESCKMGFPEVLFNLFPGMGAYSFLQRKVGRRTTEELILSGNTYTARQLYDMGIVDVITADGTGEAAVANYVRKHGRGSNGRRAFERVRRDFEAVTKEELLRHHERLGRGRDAPERTGPANDGPPNTCSGTKWRSYLTST